MFLKDLFVKAGRFGGAFVGRTSQLGLVFDIFADKVAFLGSLGGKRKAAACFFLDGKALRTPIDGGKDACERMRAQHGFGLCGVDVEGDALGDDLCHHAEHSACLMAARDVAHFSFVFDLWGLFE